MVFKIITITEAIPNPTVMLSNFNSVCVVVSIVEFIINNNLLSNHSSTQQAHSNCKGNNGSPTLER